MNNPTDNKPRKKLRLLAEIFIDSVLAVVAIYVLVYSTQQYLRTWFNSNFADNYSLFVSMGLALVSVSLPLSSFVVKKRLGHPPPQKPLPSEVKKEDYPDLKKEARNIKARRSDPLYGTLISAPPIYVGYVLVLFSQWLLGYLAAHQYLNFILLLAPLAQAVAVLVLFGVIVSALTVVPMLVTLMGSMYLVRRYLNYPKDEDWIFAECILIAECLSRNDRSGAHREVRSFLASLTSFSRNWFNTKRKVYSEELSTLRKSKMALCRMVRFSEDHTSNQIGEMFVDLGVSLKRGDDPSSFRNINFVIERSKPYEPIGRWRRYFGNIEMYPVTFNLINLLVSVTIIVLAVTAFVLGYPAISSLLRG